jgi:hypothetical protein
MRVTEQTASSHMKYKNNFACCSVAQVEIPGMDDAVSKLNHMLTLLRLAPGSITHVYLSAARAEAGPGS